MEYYVVFNTKCTLLEAEVNERIRAGWKPLGGIAVSTDFAYREDGDNHSEIYFAQAMTREQVL